MEKDVRIIDGSINCPNYGDITPEECGSFLDRDKCCECFIFKALYGEVDNTRYTLDNTKNTVN